MTKCFQEFSALPFVEVDKEKKAQRAKAADDFDQQMAEGRRPAGPPPRNVDFRTVILHQGTPRARRRCLIRKLVSVASFVAPVGESNQPSVSARVMMFSSMAADSSRVRATISSAIQRHGGIGLPSVRWLERRQFIANREQTEFRCSAQGCFDLVSIPTPSQEEQALGWPTLPLEPHHHRGHWPSSCTPQGSPTGLRHHQYDDDRMQVSISFASSPASPGVRSPLATASSSAAEALMASAHSGDGGGP